MWTGVASCLLTVGRRCQRILQIKLMISQLRDKYEQKADRVADVRAGGAAAG